MTVRVIRDKLISSFSNCPTKSIYQDQKNQEKDFGFWRNHSNMSTLTSQIGALITPPPEEHVHPNILAYRKLTPEQRALRITDPHECASLPAVQCYGCGKAIRHMAIEDALRSGKPISQVLRELSYVRICCQKSIQQEPLYVDIQKQKALEQSTIDKMRNLTVLSTSAGVSVGSAGSSVGSALSIMSEIPPGLIQAGIPLYSSMDILPEPVRSRCFGGIGETYLVKEDVPIGDVFELLAEQEAEEEAEEEEED